jgi:hypothetical protein
MEEMNSSTTTNENAGKHSFNPKTLNRTANSNEIVSKFITSSTYNRIANQINTYGDVSQSEVTADSIVIDGKGTFHYFTIVIRKNGNINATLDVVDLHDSKNLPYNDKYAMNLNDMSNFNTANLSGSIKLYDLNYDNFNHTEVKINSNKIEDIIYNRPSSEFLNKFSSLRLTKNNILENFSNVSYGARRLPCDSNGNGNLSFFECYGCFKSAAEVENTFGNWWCDVPVAGWASCWASISASCAILSGVY